MPSAGVGPISQDHDTVIMPDLLRSGWLGVRASELRASYYMPPALVWSGDKAVLVRLFRME
jgi:hypothetical protein